MNDDRYKNMFNNFNFNTSRFDCAKFYESTGIAKMLNELQESINQQILPTKIMMDTYRESYKALLEPIAQITENYQNIIQPIFE